VREWGGIERYTADLATGLARRGHEVHVIAHPTGHLADVCSEAGVQIHRVDLGLAVGWHSAIGQLNHPLNWLDLNVNLLRGRLTAVLDGIEATRGRIDVVHAQQVKEKLWATQYAREHAIASAWTAHAPLEPWMRTGAPGSMHTRMGARIDGLIAVNRATLDDYRAFGIQPALSRVIYNGLEVSRYDCGERGATRSSLGLAGDDIAVLMLARPYAGKGIGVLIDAMSLIQEAASGCAVRVRAFVAGGSRHLESFRQSAASRGLGDALTFLGHRDDVPDLLAASDIAALPSYQEGLPYAISEAMAASLPVVATRVGGVPEMIDDGESGYLIEPGDASALAERLTRLATDAELRRRMGGAAARLAADRFTLEKMLDESEAFFLSLAGRDSV